MADNIKISELDALAAAGDSTILPVVDGGTTKKMSISTLKTHLTASFATDSELSTQVSNLNSTINGLTTSDISEGTNQYFTNARVDTRLGDLNVITSSAGVELTSADNTGFDTSYVSENASNLYYTDARVKTKLNTEGVYSGSSDFDTAVSTSAAAAGFGTGGGGGGGTDNWNNLTNVPSGLVSSSTQITDVIDNDYISASAASSGFGAGGGGGGSSDYVSNVSFADTTLTFTGVGSAFSSTIDLSSGDLATQNDINGFLGIGTYTTDSASFASRIDAGGGGGASIPDGTVSSSAQTIEHLGGTGMVSSSAQIDGSQIDLTSLTTDDITQGVTNKYYADSLVNTYLNTKGVLSGSVASGDWNTLANKPANIVSSSTQIELLGFVTTGTFNTGTASLQQQINDISSSQGSVSLSDVNTFNAIQKFASGIEVTGSIEMRNGDINAFGGTFSGSGANLFGIPATAIVGGVALSGSTIQDGDNSVVASAASGVTITSQNSGVNVYGDMVMRSGSFSGSGAGLTGIPGSAIEGGVDGQKIYSSSFSASITDNGDFLVNTYAIFEGNVYSSGSVTAQSISVGTSGTPTIYSANNLNLSASNAVVVTDSPLRLNPFAAADTASFTLSEGDLVYSSDDNDFFGYRIVNSTGSWYSLTTSTATSIDWDYVAGKPAGLISSSAQIGSIGGGLFSSSAQFLPSGAADGTIYFEDSFNNISGSSDFTYTAGTRTLNVNKLIANEIVANTSLTEPGSSTGSYGRVETDALSINSAIEFPTSDGTPNQVLKTDGNGNLDFEDFAVLLGNDNLSTNGTMTMGTGSVLTNFGVNGTLNIGSPVHSTISNQSTTIDVDNLSLLSSGSLILSSSVNVTIQDVLVLPERTTNPSNPQDGTLIVSSSAGQLRPYFWDGSAWKGISFTS